jgi:hypothetical protein
MKFTQRVLSWNVSQNVLKLFFIVSALEGLGTLVYLLSLPADPKNSVFLGYSMRRLMVIGLIVLGSLVLGGLAIRLGRTPEWRQRIEDWTHLKTGWFYTVLTGFIILFLSGWMLSWSPTYRFYPYDLFFKGFFPVIVWTTLICVQAALTLVELKFGLRWSKLRDVLAAQKRLLRTCTAFLGFILLVWLFIILTGIGLDPDTTYWNSPGVPIRSVQVWASWILGMGILVLSSVLASHWRNNHAVSWGVDVLIFVLMWALAASIWVQEPQVRSFFAPYPAPPNYEYYPVSDAMVYDVGGQTAIIGQGLGNGGHVDKPLLATFMALLHMIVGQDFSQMANFQAAVLALLPGLLYLLGKSLHSRPAGVVAGLLGLFKGQNAIASGWMVLSANPKVLTSEYPMALVLVLFTVFMVCWLKAPEKHIWAAIMAGGMIGIGTLVRHNAWAFVPILLLIAGIAYWRKWRKAILVSVVLLGAMLISIAPWMWRTNQLLKTPLYFMAPLRSVVWEDRYVPLESQSPDPTAVPTEEKDTKPTSAATEPQTPLPSAVFSESIESEVPNPEVGEQSGPEEKVAAEPPLPVPVVDKEGPPTLVERLKIAAKFIPRHYLHNWVTSALILPTSLINDDLQTTITAPGSVWDPAWSAGLSLISVLFMLFNLTCIALGAGFAWTRWRLAGLVPFITFAVYHLGTGVARTSGGRYIVPVDWVVYFYFAIGLVQLSIWLAGLTGFSVREESEDAGVKPVDLASGGKIQWRWSYLLVIGILALVGAAPVIADKGFPQRYPDLNKQEAIALLQERGTLDRMGYEQQELDAFLADNNSTVWYGRGLYPRFYYVNEGVPSRDIYKAMDYSRLIFIAVGPHGIRGSILPQTVDMGYFPNGADILYLGCTYSKANVLALVILEETQDTILTRSPEASLTCPARDPVCDGNRNCR